MTNKPKHERPYQRRPRTSPGTGRRAAQPRRSRARKGAGFDFEPPENNGGLSQKKFLPDAPSAGSTVTADERTAAAEQFVNEMRKTEELAPKVLELRTPQIRRLLQEMFAAVPHLAAAFAADNMEIVPSSEHISPPPRPSWLPADVAEAVEIAVAQARLTAQEAENLPADWEAKLQRWVASLAAPLVLRGQPPKHEIDLYAVQGMRDEGQSWVKIARAIGFCKHPPGTPCHCDDALRLRLKKRT